MLRSTISALFSLDDTESGTRSARVCVCVWCCICWNRGSEFPTTLGNCQFFCGLGWHTKKRRSKKRKKQDLANLKSLLNGKVQQEKEAGQLGGGRSRKLKIEDSEERL